MNMRSTRAVVTDMQNGGMSIDPLHTALVIGYEIGDVQKDTFYATVRGADLRPGYVADLKCAAADAVMQLRVLLHVFGLDFEEIVTMGEERVYERLAEFAKKQRPRPTDEIAQITTDPDGKVNEIRAPEHWGIRSRAGRRQALRDGD